MNYSLKLFRLARTKRIPRSINAATSTMPGSSSRLCSASTAACRSILLNTVTKFREAFRSGSKSCESLGVAFLSESRPVYSSTPISSVVNSARVAFSRSRRTSQGAIEGRRWESQCSTWPRLLSQSNLELPSRGVSCSYSSSVISGSSSQSRQFASSTAYAAKRPGRAQEEGKGKGNSRIRSQFKSRKGGVVAREVRQPFRGALSSIKHLESEQVRGKSRPSSVRGGARKQDSVSPGRSFRKPERVLRSPTGKKFSPSRQYRFKDRPADQGLKLKRKRKRIKPRPRDATYKRGLDSDIINVASETKQKPATEEKVSSLNAQFRRIQPSREVLALIEENLLGRRRLAEWRKGGYDPKRTAPLDDLPDGQAKRNPIQETIFKYKLTFIAAAKQASSLPPLVYPEVAFAGRSNVGKSSLINSLTRRWGVARTSEKPGLTQSINFFTLGSQLCLVDLPGYGFAYAKEEKKDQWEELVKHYVQTRTNLKRVCVLVDAKWGLKPRDEELLHLMESAGTRYQIVVTKTDILPPADLARRATQILQVVEDHRCFLRPLVMVSAKTGAGLQLFRASLAGVALSKPRMLEEDSL